MKQYIALALMLLVLPMALAVPDLNGELNPEEQAQVDNMLEPVMKIYNLIKYAATLLGVIVIAFAGITFMTSGGEQGKKEKAKHMGSGVVIGLILIWIAPVAVQFIFS